MDNEVVSELRGNVSSCWSRVEGSVAGIRDLWQTIRKEMKSQRKRWFSFDEIITMQQSYHEDKLTIILCTLVLVTVNRLQYNRQKNKFALTH